MYCPSFGRNLQGPLGRCRTACAITKYTIEATKLLLHRSGKVEEKYIEFFTIRFIMTAQRRSDQNSQIRDWASSMLKQQRRADGYVSA